MGRLLDDMLYIFSCLLNYMLRTSSMAIFFHLVPFFVPSERWLQALPLLGGICCIQAKSTTWKRSQFFYLVLDPFQTWKEYKISIKTSLKRFVKIGPEGKFNLEQKHIVYSY